MGSRPQELLRSVVDEDAHDDLLTRARGGHEDTVAVASALGVHVVRAVAKEHLHDESSTRLRK